MERATTATDLRNCVDALKREIDQLESLASDTRSQDAVLQQQVSRSIDAQREFVAAAGENGGNIKRKADGAATARHAPQKPVAAPYSRSAAKETAPGAAVAFQRAQATPVSSHPRTPVASASAREHVAGSGCRVVKRVNAGWAIPSEWDAPPPTETTRSMPEFAGPPCVKPKTSVVSARATANEVSSEPPPLPWKESTASNRLVSLSSSSSSSLPSEAAFVSIRVRRTDGVVSEIPKRFKPTDYLSAVFLECSRLHFIPVNIRAQDVFVVVPWLREKYGFARAEHVSLREASLCPTATVTLEIR